MANYASLKTAIQNVIKTNGNNEITGALLQQILLAMVNSLGSGYQFVGVATPTTNPGSPDAPVFYLAGISGVYSHFGITVQDEIAVIANNSNGNWTKQSIISEATTGKTGVMSAKDKQTLDKHSESITRILSLLYLESRVDFDNTVIGSSNTFFDLSEPINVKKGDKLKFQVQLTATNSNSFAAYLWSANTYVTEGAYLEANYTEVTFDIIADATITRLSLRGDNVISGSLFCVIEGVITKINQNSEEIQQIKSTGYDPTIVDGSYLSDLGEAYSDAGYKRTNYIPVIEGETLSITGRKVCAYDEAQQFVSVLSNSGGDIIIPSRVRYIRVDAGKTADLVITRYGSTMLGVASLQDVSNANDSFRNIYSKFILSSGYYAASNGSAQADSNYIKTDYIRVSSNVYLNIPPFRTCFYDADKNFLSFTEAVKSHFVVPENAAYVTFSYRKTDVEGKNLVIYGDRINEFIVYRDELDNEIKQLREEVANSYVTNYDNNLTNQQDSTVTVVSGEYGAVGSKYRLPIKCTGKYSLHFEFKYPTNVDGSRIEILRFGNIAGSFNGGCRVYLDNLGYAISEQQVRSGRVVALAPITSDNNYVAKIGPSISYESYISLQTGNDAFSLRYLGSNQEAKMSLTDSGLVFTGVTGVNTIAFPANASMLDFANTLKTMCAVGGSLNGVFEFTAYDVFGRSTADLTKVDNIPLYYTYSYGADNFPVFVPYKDNNWHSVDIVFDSSDANGQDLLSFFFDGHRVGYIDNGFTLTGNGVFNTNVTIGGNGVAVRNLKYTDRCTEIDAPAINVEMLHNIKDELSLGGQESISVNEIERVITVYKKHGYKHVPISEIGQYIRGNKSLSGKCFCLIHDDYFFNSQKLLNLYKGLDCKVCFSIINELLNTDVAEDYKKNALHFEYAIHSQTNYASLKYDSLLQQVRNDMANLGSRLDSITNLLVYPYGATNIGIGKVLFHEGITVALIVGNGPISMNCNPMLLPRMPSRANGAFENLDNQLANVDKYYKQ